MSTANQLILNRFLFRTTWTIVFHKQLHFNYYTLARHYILTRSCVEKLNRSQCKSRYDEESGKTLRTCDDSIVKQTLQWMPHGHRGRGRPKNTRNRDLEMWTAGYTYSWRKTKVTAEKELKMPPTCHMEQQVKSIWSRAVCRDIWRAALDWTKSVKIP